MKVKEFIGTLNSKDNIAIYGWFNSESRYSSLWGYDTVDEWKKDGENYGEFDIEETQESIHGITLIYLTGKKEVAQRHIASTEKYLAEREERIIKTLSMRVKM